MICEVSMIYTYISIHVALIGKDNFCETFAAPDAALFAAELDGC